MVSYLRVVTDKTNTPFLKKRKKRPQGKKIIFHAGRGKAVKTLLPK